MLYRPKNVAEIWDTWLYYESGVHYLFTLHKSEGTVWDGISLSTSLDGVHFQEQGIIVSKRPDAEWLGTGSTWRVGEKYYLNFSECRQGVQSIFFAESADLLHWTVMEGNECRPDPRWYDVTPAGRWDCIWTVPLEEGGYVGYLTAVPLSGESGRVGASVGKVISEDGIHWRAAPPPAFEWGDMPAIDLYEVGAVERFGGYYHMMVGMGEERLGSRQFWRELGGQFGMYHFLAENPNGPFRPAAGSFRLLGSPSWMTYFSRFYPHPGGMLVCHHSCEKTPETAQIYLAPLKSAHTEGEDMELAWWTGNERMLGAQRPLAMEALQSVYQARGIQWAASGRSLSVEPNVGGVVLRFQERFDPRRGASVDFRFQVQPGAGRMGAMGIWLGTERGKTAFVMETRERTAIGELTDAGSFLAHSAVEKGCIPGKWHQVRLLARFSLAELYLDGRLIQCYSLPAALDGTFGLVVESAQARVEEAQLRKMTLEGGVEEET